jgi:Tol biopolymer transport system component
VEDRRYRMARPRWMRTAIGLSGILFVGALVALSPGTKTSGYADSPTGTPSYLPLAMKSIPTPTPTPTPTPLGGGRIAFESNRVYPGIFEIYSMNSDGSDVRRVTHLGEYSRDASWSPDYRRIVFDSGPQDYEEEREIYIINAHGTWLVQLTSNGVKDWDPSWSPDGSRIAYTSRLEGNWDIYSMNTSGGERENLTRRPGPDMDPCWSPDGTKIAFDSEYGGSDYHIWVMNADGSGQKQLTFGSSVDDTDPSWSTDGTRIAFESNRDGDIEIWVMNATDGSEARNLTKNPSSDVDPSWMNGAERIVFGSYRTGNGEVYIMNSDGSDVQRLTNDPMTDGDACARPGCP